LPLSRGNASSPRFGRLTSGLDAGKCPAMPPNEPGARSARLGRRLGLLAFAVPVAGATAIWTLQILRAVFWPDSQPTTLDCRQGVVELEGALRRARRAAAQEPTGERAALDSFRRALAPEWQSRETLSGNCRSDPAALKALSELDALRYAEEHAVRYEAVALAKQRRRAEAIRREFGGASEP
jgi:hypothetical protein